MSAHDIALPLIANSERIGALLVKPLPLTWRGRLASGIILPIAGISLALGLFVFLVAFLLIRRFINPLADVMYAARAVADGKLETRMATEGPQDLRLLTLAESRQLHFEYKPVDLGNLAAHVTDLFQAEAREKNISLSLSRLSENLSVEADAQRTEQVIANLVSNALRYVPEGGRVWVEISSDEKTVNLSVNDNGKGIPEADLPFIFDRFWRKDKSRSRISGGTGLGLAIAKQLIEAQGGEISASNLPEGGLQVRLLFEK